MAVCCTVHVLLRLLWVNCKLSCCLVVVADALRSGWHWKFIRSHKFPFAHDLPARITTNIHQFLVLGCRIPRNQASCCCTHSGLVMVASCSLAFTQSTLHMHALHKSAPACCFSHERPIMICAHIHNWPFPCNNTAN